MPEATITDAKPPVTTAPEPIKPGKDAFVGNNMLKFAEQAGLLKPDYKPESAEPPAPKKADAPCKDCGKDGKPAAKPAAAPTTPTSPFRVLEVDGKKYVFETEADYKEALASKRDFEERDKKWEAMSQPLSKLVNLIEQGKMPEAAAAMSELKRDEGELDLEDVHPAIRKKIADLEAQLAKVRPALEQTQAREQEAMVNDFKAKVENLVTEVRAENPVTPWEDPDTKEDKSKELIAGQVSVLVNSDAMRAKVEPGFKMKDTAWYITEAIKKVHAFENHIRGTEGGNGKDLTEAALRTGHPHIVKSIEQAAVAEYLRANENTPPSLRSSGSETSRMDTPGSNKKGLKSFDAFMKAAEEDPEIIEGIKRGSRASA
jgi:hypothetical protein